MKAIARYIHLLLFILLLATSFISNENLFLGIIHSKIVWFYFIIALVLIFLAFKTNTFPGRSRFNSLDTLVYIWFAYVIVNTFVHTGTAFGVKSIQQLGLFVSYFFIKDVFRNEQKQNVIVIIILLLTIAQNCIAYLQWFEIIPSFNNNFKITGYFFNPAPYSIFLSALLAFSFSIFLYHSKKVFRFIALALFLVGLPVILVLFSRSSWIALGLVITFLLSIKLGIVTVMIAYFQNWNSRIFGIVFLIALLTVSVYYLYFLKKDSADGRLLTWKVSAMMIKDNFLTGKGDGGMEGQYLKYQSEYFAKHPERMQSEGVNSGKVVYAFNDLLQITVEQGIIGFFISLLIFATCIKYSRNVIKAYRGVSNSVGTGVFSFISVILISGMFSYPLTVLPIQILFFLGLAYISNRHDEISPVKTEHNYGLKMMNFILRTFCMTGGVVFLLYAILSLRAYKLTREIYNENFDTTLISKLLRTEIPFKNESWFLLMKAEYYLKTSELEKAKILLENSKKISSDTRIYYTLGKIFSDQKQFKKAEEQYLFLYYALPALMRPKYELAKFYFDSRQINKGNQYSKIVLDFKPRIESVYTVDMKERISRMRGNLPPSTNKKFLYYDK